MTHRSRSLGEAIAGAAALAGAAGICGLVSFLMHRDVPAVRLACAEVRGVTIDDMMDPGAGDVLWVDARWEQAHEEGHLAGAVSFNEVNWEAQVSSLVFAWRPGMRVVVYAEAGEGRVARRVAALAHVAIGLPDVSYLDGDWREARWAFGSAGGAQ